MINHEELVKKLIETEIIYNYHVDEVIKLKTEITQIKFILRNNKDINEFD